MTITPEMINGLVNEFNDEIYIQVQEKLSKTKPFVDVVSIEKENMEIDNIGGVEFTKNNDSFVKVDDVASDIKYSKRLLGTDSYKLAHRINNELAMMLAPNSSKYKDRVIEQIVNQYNFMIDKVIYEAMDADVKLKNGSSVSFASDGGQTEDLKALADFTAAKVLEAKQMLTKQGFGIADNSGIAWLITDVERSLLEKDTSISNVDYKIGYGVMQNQDGDLKRFKGIDLITFASAGNEANKPFFYKNGSTLGTHYRKTFMFNTGKNGAGQSAITLGIRKDCITDIFEPKEYFDTTFIKGSFNIGAIRNANSGIVLVKTPVSMS